MADERRKVRCDQCGWEGFEATDAPEDFDANGKRRPELCIPLWEMSDLWERLNIGEDVPAGECPHGECAGAVYLAETPEYRKPRVLITVSGGVADYVADKDVRVHIADWDNAVLGRLTILGVDHHVELLEVEIDPETKEMRPVAYYGEDGVGSIGNHNGQRYEELCTLTNFGVHETVSLDGRQWVLYVTPFGD